MALEYQIREAGLMEDVLRTSELRYRRLFESANDGLLIIDADSHEVIDANAFLLELTGYSLDELTGTPLHNTHLFLDPQINHKIVEELPTRQRLRIDHLELKCKAGKPIDAELTCRLHREGPHTIIQCNIHDITERRRSDALLLGQKRVLEMLATGEELREVLATLIRVIEAQSEGVFGAVLVRQKDAQHFRMGVAPSLPAEYTDAMGKAEIERPYFGPCAMTADLGEPVGTADIASDRRWSRDWQALALKHGLQTCYSSPIFSSNGRVLGAFGLYQCGLKDAEPPDPQLLETATHLAGIAIERRQIEKALRASDRRKDEFLAMLSHELRNPLAAIRNAVQLLEMAGNEPAVLQSASGILHRQVGQMVRLVDDLLEVSRISRGKVKLHKERVELSSVIRQALESTQGAIESMGHELSVSLPPEPVYLDGDRCRLAQVVANLLDNACKYTGKGGNIWLQANVEGGQIVIRVRDNGMGIDDTSINTIFDMFSQVEASLERTHGGLGIGLTLVKALVKLHGGYVDVHSDGCGQGSEFTVRLPKAAALPEENSPIETASNTCGHRILIVDDDVDAAASLGMLLQLNGHQIRTVHEPTKAVDAAAAFQPHVVLLDIGMPKMNGYEVAQELRRRLPEQQVALVALTGWGQDQDRRRSEEAGFDGHLVKPADYAALTRVISCVAPRL